MEKLLRTCDVESIYILIRSKKNEDIHTRVGKIFDDPVSFFEMSDNIDEFLRVLKVLVIEFNIC
jgi:hypothetical protein